MTTTTPLFTITAKKSLLDDLTLYEKVDKVILNKLINSSLLKKTFHNKYAEKVYHNEKEQLIAYASKMKYGKVKVTYNKNKNNKYGRSNPDKALGLFCIRREIRHTLCGETMADIDVNNCHLVILNQLCENENINHDELNKYVKNRDEYFTTGMNAYGCSREDIKVLFIIYCYGGGIKKWIHNREIDITKCSTEAVYNDTIIEIPIMKQFHDSMANIHMEIGKRNQELCSIVIKNKNDNNITEFNLWGTVCSFVLQEYECRMLEAMYKYLIKNKIVINDLCVLCADGLMIDKKKYTPDLLYKLKDVIKTEVGFDVELSQKEMNSGYLDILDDNIIKEAEIVESNDNDALFKKMSAEFELKHTKIVNKSLFVKKVDDCVIFMTKKDLLTSYEHVQCGLNRSGNPESFIKRWTTCNNSINVKDDMENYPDVDNCPPNIFNLWTPFVMEKYTEPYETNTDALEFILNHIRVLCGNDELVHNYFVNWIAKMIQQPYKKLPCIVLISDEGSGKGTLMKLLAKMMGDKKVFETATPSRDVWGHFNELMMDAFLVNLNELEFAETQSAEGKIKALITDTQMTINPKGTKPIKINSYHHYIVTTNKDNAVNSKKGDRRKLIARSSDELKGNTIYFNKMHKMLEDNIVIRTCYDYFKNHDISGFDETVMPTTEFQDDLKEMAVTAPEQWLKDFIIEKQEERSVELTGNEIYTRFVMWCDKNNTTYNTTPLKLGIKIKNLQIDGIDKGNPTRQGKVKTFNIEKMKKYFNIGCLIDI